MLGTTQLLSQEHPIYMASVSCKLGLDALIDSHPHNPGIGETIKPQATMPMTYNPLYIAKAMSTIGTKPNTLLDADSPYSPISITLSSAYTQYQDRSTSILSPKPTKY